jgi:hypothetical protein
LLVAPAQRRCSQAQSFVPSAASVKRRSLPGLSTRPCFNAAPIIAMKSWVYLALTPSNHLPMP